MVPLAANIVDCTHNKFTKITRTASLVKGTALAFSTNISTSYDKSYPVRID